MPHTFTRQALYEMAWSQPVQSLAKSLSLSDRGLAKICAAANIPVPTRGYWAKKHAGKRLDQIQLPARVLGQSDTVHIRGDRNSNASEDADILRAPIPPPPVFEPDMATVQAQAVALVAKAPLPLRDSYGWHSQIQRLLNADEGREQKQRASAFPLSWDAPIFRSLFEKRRLRIVNALFTCLTRCGLTPRVSGKEGRELSVIVGDSRVPLVLESIAAAKHVERERQGYGFTPRMDKDRMRLSISNWWGSEKLGPSWDRAGAPLERRLRDIAAAIIVFGEQSVRESAASAHAWRIKRKAELEDAERKRQAEEERRRQERLAQLEKARIDHLIGQARALDQAEQVRAYVKAVQALNTHGKDHMSADELASWASWALAQADRIDPVVSGVYKTRPAEPSE